MKNGTILYFKEQKNIDNIKKIEISTHVEPESSNSKKESYIKYNGMKIRVDKEKVRGARVRGFISVSKKENKKDKQSISNISSAIDGKIAIHKKLKSTEVVIGYIGINGGTYGVVKQGHLAALLIPLALVIAMIIISLFIIKPAIIDYEQPTSETEEESTDEKGKGSLDTEKPTYDKNGFRLKINTAPRIENGKINVRIESPKEQNEEFVAVYDYYITAKVKANGTIIKQYKEPINIYTSSKVYADENIEYGKTKEDLDEGYYTGVCYCSVYDKDGNFLVTSGAALNLYDVD